MPSNLKAIKCLSCEIVNGTRSTSGGTIYENENFHAHQDVAYPIPGLVIVAAKRHFKCLDEMTREEYTNFLPFLLKIREGQRKILDIKEVYYFYNEDTTHHFHMWMVPRFPWMYQFGRSIESVRPAMLHAREAMSDEKCLATLELEAMRLKEFLSS